MVKGKKRLDKFGIYISLIIIVLAVMFVLTNLDCVALSPLQAGAQAGAITNIAVFYLFFIVASFVALVVIIFLVYYFLVFR